MRDSWRILRFKLRTESLDLTIGLLGERRVLISPISVIHVDAAARDRIHRVFPINATAERIKSKSLNSHLRSIKAVSGYHIEATDGEIGHADGFIVDDEA